MSSTLLFLDLSTLFKIKVLDLFIKRCYEIQAHPCFAPQIENVLQESSWMSVMMGSYIIIYF